MKIKHKNRDFPVLVPRFPGSAFRISSGTSDNVVPESVLDFLDPTANGIVIGN